MSRKIILLFDSPVGDDHFLYRALKQEGLTVRKVDSPSRYPSILNWAIGCMKATFGPQATDTIVCWYDFQAVLCYWIGRLLFRKRNIVAINILLKDKKTLRNKIVAWFYKKALTSSHMAASVTARAYGDSLNERFCTNICFFRVRDVYSPTLYEESDFRFCGNSVFCGGRNGRDWKTVIETARRMPDVVFHVVMPENIQKKFRCESIPNINVYSHLPLGEFNGLLRNSSIVMLPIDTAAPAGLIVLFTAAANRKLVITTSTPVTREYIDGNTGVLIDGNDIGAYVSAINFHLKHPEEIRRKGDNLLNDLQQTCSEKEYAENINRIIRHLT